MNALELTATQAKVEIASASLWDLWQIYRLEKACFPMDSWSVWDIFFVLTLPNVIRLKAVDAGRVVGFLVAELKPGKDLAWIATFGVDPACRQQGIGSALLQTCERGLRTRHVRLSVRIGNDPAIRLYRHFGYQVSDTWPAYYKGGEDALIMEKRLPG